MRQRKMSSLIMLDENILMEKLNSIEEKILELSDEISQNKILLRVNNLLLARFILQLSQVRNDFNLPKRNTFFKFEILDDDYQGLCKEYGKDIVDKTLYRLDRTLLLNKQDCPHNIKKYITNKIKEHNKRMSAKGNITESNEQQSQ